MANDVIENGADLEIRGVGWLGRLLFEPHAFFEEDLCLVRGRTVLWLYLAVGGILFTHEFLQLILFSKVHHIPSEEVGRALILFAAVSILAWLIPLLYLFEWRALHELRNCHVTRQATFNWKAALFIILSGELIYAFGLAMTLPVDYVLRDPDWSLSIGSQLARHWLREGILVWVLNRFDLFSIWEIVVISAGLRVLYGWHTRSCQIRSYIWSIAITQGPLVLQLLTVRYISSGR